MKDCKIIDIDAGDGNKIKLIFAAYYQYGDGCLDYLQDFHDIQNNPGHPGVEHQMARAEELKERYEKWQPIAVRNLLRKFSELEPSFFPDAIFSPPTTALHLQEHLVRRFRDRYPEAIYLNEFIEQFEKDGKRNFCLRENAPSEVLSAKQILILDDVYGKGDTIRLAMTQLGKNKSFVAICLVSANSPDSEASSDLRRIAIDTAKLRVRQWESQG